MKKQAIICFVLFIALILCACSEVQNNTTSSQSNSFNQDVSTSSQNKPVPGQSSSASSQQSTSSSQSSATSSQPLPTTSHPPSSSTPDIDNPKQLAFLAVKEANGIDEAAIAFAIDMLKASQKDGENSMISPLSILTALGMTANGADGNTLKQMEEVMFGGKTIEEFNDYYNQLVNRITKPKNGVLSLANSTWYRDEPNRLTMNPDFIKLVEKEFGSEIRPADFNDKNTVNLINNWVKDKTNGFINKIIDEKIPDDTIIYLINALYFEQKWQSQYTKYQVNAGKFHTKNGDVDADFMSGDESIYLKDDKVQGFIKPYEGREFSFVALLPNEGVTAEEYISKLTGKKVLDLLKNQEKSHIMASIPKFKTEFQASLVEPLKSLGITDAFSSGKADLTKMATSTNGNIYIGNVLHKTFIEVNEAGTKAAAVTAVEVNDEAYVEYKATLIFDRPFVYMIIDNQTNLPLFIGILNNPKK